MTENVDVIKEREDFLKELQLRVDKAFKNRKNETYEPQTENTPEEIEQQKEIRNMFEGLSDDEYVFLGVNLDKPHQVSVSNPHDYKDLLKMSINKLVEAGVIDSNEVDSIIQHTLEHEFKHSIPTIGQDFVRTQYGVSFVENAKKDLIGITPYVGLSGMMRVSVYKDSIGNVRNPSAADKVHNETN